jgi:hypothetical protein
MGDSGIQRLINGTRPRDLAFFLVCILIPFLPETSPHSTFEASNDDTVEWEGPLGKLGQTFRSYTHLVSDEVYLSRIFLLYALDYKRYIVYAAHSDNDISHCMIEVKRKGKNEP